MTPAEYEAQMRMEALGQAVKFIGQVGGSENAVVGVADRFYDFLIGRRPSPSHETPSKEA